MFLVSLLFSRVTIISIFQPNTFWTKSTQVANKAEKTENEI